MFSFLKNMFAPAPIKPESKDALGDRMKDYERVETDRRLDQSLPIYARIDGRGFSKFTLGLRKPFDSRLSSAMIETTRHLVEKTGARIGYTQSDEISLVWLVEGEAQEMMFAAKAHKLTSVLAGMATAAFTRAVSSHHDADFAAYADKLPHFDARVFNLPSKTEAANAVLWRERDAVRNAVSMAAQAHFSHKALQNVSQAGMLLMLDEEGVHFDGYPASFRRGTFLRRFTFERELTTEELMKINPHVRPAPGTKVTRADIGILPMPPFNEVLNRVEVIFDGADPVTA